MADSKKIQITLSNVMMQRLEKLCEKSGLKKSTLVTLALTEYIERQRKLDEMEAKHR